MSDFDEVLERLLTDPAFQAALAADPDATLAGYHLDPDERRLLHTQFSTGAGPDRLVEARETKSGVVGLVGPVAAAFGVASGFSSGSQSLGTAAASQSLGQAPGSASFGSAPAGTETFGASGGTETLGTGPTQSFGAAGPVEGIGSAVSPDDGSGPAVPATDYHTRVDVDGDGTWDRYTAVERGDGGVDIRVDHDADGRVDFIGHDHDRDGLVDSADYDLDADGRLETRMYDDSGDGWLDRSAEIPPSDGHSQTFGQAPRSR
ncbi:MAG TPA: hypothetical protein VF163_08415 [Micromonosporaceae bacterium]